MPGSRTKVCFRLYVAGESPNSQRALANLRAFCSAHYAGRHEIEVVDVLDQPEQALENQIFLTPQLVFVSASPSRAIVGDLSDSAVLLRALVAGDISS